MFLSRSHSLSSVAMATKHVRTVSDLVRFGCAYPAECLSCGRRTEFDAWAIAQAFGSCHLDEVEPRLICSVCRSKRIRAGYRAPPAQR
jgi:ABC-type enterochelin transport system ATPase subunit